MTKEIMGRPLRRVLQALGFSFFLPAVLAIGISRVEGAVQGLRGALVSDAARATFRRTVKPFPMNNVTFVHDVQAAPPGDLLVLLYSPTCPDCQWFIDKVWWKTAAALQTDVNVQVWTVADPGFAAPKPFEHWHNPALFFAPADARLHPIMFAEAQLGKYLTGDPKIPQDQQDASFLNELLRFVKEQEFDPEALPQPPSPASEQAQQDLEKLATKEWGMLQKRWASESQSSTPGKKPKAPPGAVPTKVDKDALAKSYAAKYVDAYVKTHRGYDRKSLLTYALKYYEKYEKRGAGAVAFLQAPPVPPMPSA